jgi:hypothetical protein
MKTIFEAYVDGIDLPRRDQRLVQQIPALIFFEGVWILGRERCEQPECCGNRLKQILHLLDTGLLGLCDFLFQSRFDRGGVSVVVKEQDKYQYGNAEQDE